MAMFPRRGGGEEVRRPPDVHPEDKPRVLHVRGEEYRIVDNERRPGPGWAVDVASKRGSPNEQAIGILEAVTSMAQDPRASINEFGRELDEVGELLHQSEVYVAAVVNRHAVACNAVAASVNELRKTIQTAATMLRQVLAESRNERPARVDQTAEASAPPPDEVDFARAATTISSPGEVDVPGGLLAGAR